MVDLDPRPYRYRPDSGRPRSDSSREFAFPDAGQISAESGLWDRRCRLRRRLRLGDASHFGACFSKYVSHNGHSVCDNVDRRRSQALRRQLHQLPWRQRSWRRTGRFELANKTRGSFCTAYGPAHGRRSLLVGDPRHSASGMPGFADVLTNDERWDIINFLGAFSVGYQARVIEPKINPGRISKSPAKPAIPAF